MKKAGRQERGRGQEEKTVVGVAQRPQRELPTGSVRALESSRFPPSQGFWPPPGQKKTEPSQYLTLGSLSREPTPFLPLVYEGPVWQFLWSL